MKLYKVKALYLGKDLDDTVIIGYIVAKNDVEAFQIIDDRYANWIESMLYEEIPDYDDSKGEDPTVEELLKTKMGKLIMKDKGDFNDEYKGEFYDIKYGWEEVAEISEPEIEVLKKFKIL